MFDLVPFAGARRKVADGEAKPGFIGQLLQFHFPETQPGTIAASAVSGDENSLRPGIQMPTFKAPPPPNGGDRKGPRVMVGAHVHKASIAPQVIDAIGKSPGYFGTREVMPADWDGLFGG